MPNHRRDPLTGLHTRAHAMAALEDLISHADEGENCGIIYLDVDNLKQLNDNNGIKYGDLYLQTLVLALQTAAHSGAQNSFVARFGGDEFLVIVPEFGSRETLMLAERIRTSAAAVTIDGYDGNSLLSLTATLGVACFPEDGETALKMLEEADLAVVIGKNHGRDCALPARNPLRRDAPPY